MIAFLVLWGVGQAHLQTENAPFKQWQKDYLVSPIAARKYSLADYFQNVLSQYCRSEELHSVESVNEQYGATQIKSLYVTGLQGQVVRSCDDLIDQNAFLLLPIYSRDDLADALTGGFNSGVEHIEENRYWIVQSLKNSDNEIVGAIVSEQTWQISRELETWSFKTKQAFNTMIQFSLSNLIWIMPSALTIAFILSRRLTRQLAQVQKVIEEWSKGNFNSKIKVNGHDEIASSLRRLNQLADDFRYLLNERTVNAETQERQRVAAELHDTVKQLLFANNLQLGSCKKSLKDAASLAAIQQAIKNNQAAFQQVNQLISTLKPQALIGENAWGTIEHIAKQWANENNKKIFVELPRQVVLSTEVAHAIIRVVQECLQNIKKHGNSVSQVHIQVNENTKGIVLNVRDDGSINDIPELGQGLELLRNRIESLQGSVEFDVDNGFRVFAKIPLVTLSDNIESE